MEKSKMHDEISEFSCTLRLKHALRTAGLLIFIVGPFQNGEHLCVQVIGLDNIVEISKVDFNENTDFWLAVASKTGLIPDINSNEKTNAILSKDTIINYYIDKNKVLVLTDFHCVIPKLQKEIAHQVKDAIRKGLKVVLLLPAQYTNIILRRNPDLSGRISVINIEN